MTTPTIADVSGVAMTAVMGVGQLVTWWLILRDDRRAASKHSAERAAAEATTAAAMKSLAQFNERIAKAVESLEDWTRQHELSDERRWALSEQFQRVQAETNARLANIAEDLARRMTHFAPDRGAA